MLLIASFHPPQSTFPLSLSGLLLPRSKLGFDYAPALVGWEYHRGLPCALYSGVVVCEVRAHRRE